MGLEGMDERKYIIQTFINFSNLIIFYSASNKLSFGTGTDRPTFPDQIPNDRFGNENTPFRGVKEV